jgi:opacity protein-like surface antigen
MQSQTKKTMKLKSCTAIRTGVLLGSASLALAATPLLADDSHTTGLYLGTDVGLNLADDLVVPGFGSISLDPGVRWDVTMGYAFKLADQLTLAPEVEVGLMYNSYDKATEFGVGSAPISGDLLQVPIVANLILNWHFSDNWVAYGGGGAGYDYFETDNNDIGLSSSESDFAWQGEAGIKYKFGASELGLGYKYLASQPSGLQTVGNSAILVSYTLHF